MEIKKIILIAVISIFSIFSIYFYLKNIKNIKLFFFTKNIDFCEKNNFNELLKLLSKYDKNVKIAEKEKDIELKKSLYKKIFENYILTPLVIKEYLEKEKVIDHSSYNIDKAFFLKIMENNFECNRFIHYLNKKITISEEEASSFYKNNQSKIFNRYPFLKIKEKISIRIIVKDDKSKTDKFYQDALKINKNCINIDNILDYHELIDNNIKAKIQTMKVSEIEKTNNSDSKIIFILKTSHVANVWKKFEEVKSEIIQELKKIKIDDFLKDLIDKKKTSLKKCFDTINSYIEEKIIAK